jgi:hypothetical protein
MVVLLLAIICRNFLFDLNITLSIKALVHCDVHLFNEETISRNAISLRNINHISYYKLSHWDRCTGSVSSSEDGHSLVVDLIFQFEELSFFDVIAGC